MSACRALFVHARFFALCLILRLLSAFPGSVCAHRSAPRLAKFSHALAAVLASRLPSLGDDGASPGSGGSSGSSGSSGSGGGIASGGGDGESKGGKTGIALESELVCERRRLCAQLYK